MYLIFLKIGTENNSFFDYFKTKREVIRFISRTTGTPAPVFAGDVVARDNSELWHDSKGWRAEIFYE